MRRARDRGRAAGQGPGDPRSEEPGDGAVVALRTACGGPPCLGAGEHEVHRAGAHAAAAEARSSGMTAALTLLLALEAADLSSGGPPGPAVRSGLAITTG